MHKVFVHSLWLSACADSIHYPLVIFFDMYSKEYCIDVYLFELRHQLCIWDRDVTLMVHGKYRHIVEVDAISLITCDTLGPLCPSLDY